MRIELAYCWFQSEFHSFNLFSKVKTEGYDGREASADEDVVDEPSQWSISGSLLFSVTVITTIGKLLFILIYIK